MRLAPLTFPPFFPSFTMCARYLKIEHGRCVLFACPCHVLGEHRVRGAVRVGRAFRFRWGLLEPLWHGPSSNGSRCINIQAVCKGAHYRGAHLGVDADLVIVSARRKPDWDQGTIVHAGQLWYRVGAIEERTMRGYLRTLYPLRAVKDHQVFRRTVEYEIPAKYSRDGDTS